MSPARAAQVRVVALVGDQLRHQWFAGRVAAAAGIELGGIVREQKRPLPQGQVPEEDEIIRRHFARRAEAERDYFEASAPVLELDTPVLEVEHGRANDLDVATWVSAREPQFLLLFGCSIIREPLLQRFAARTINLHLGLSPYYRGSATNFWALARGEPECVGITTHLATLSVDAGPILLQARPAMEPGDDAHDIGCRAIAAGADALVRATASFAAGELRGVPQAAGGLVFRNADFGADAVLELRRRLDAGMIADYLAERTTRDAARPIVE